MTSVYFLSTSLINVRHLYHTQVCVVSNTTHPSVYFPIISNNMAAVKTPRWERHKWYLTVWGVKFRHVGLGVLTTVIMKISGVMRSERASGNWQSVSQFPPVSYIDPSFLRPDCSACCLLQLISSLSRSSTLKMEAVCFSEKLIDFERYIPEDRMLQSLRYILHRRIHILISITNTR
jgi:hypothetical protein